MLHHPDRPGLHPAFHEVDLVWSVRAFVQPASAWPTDIWSVRTKSSVSSTSTVRAPSRLHRRSLGHFFASACRNRVRRSISGSSSSRSHRPIRSVPPSASERPAAIHNLISFPKLGGAPLMGPSIGPDCRCSGNSCACRSYRVSALARVQRFRSSMTSCKADLRTRNDVSRPRVHRTSQTPSVLPLVFRRVLVNLRTLAGLTSGSAACSSKPVRRRASRSFLCLNERVRIYSVSLGFVRVTTVRLACQNQSAGLRVCSFGTGRCHRTFITVSRIVLAVPRPSPMSRHNLKNSLAACFRSN